MPPKELLNAVAVLLMALPLLAVSVTAQPLESAAVVLSTNVRTGPWNVNFDTASPYVNAGAQWIWANSASAISDAPSNVGYVFEKSFTATSSSSCTLSMIADNQCDVYLNGVFSGSITGGWGGDLLQSVAVSVHSGSNTITLRCVNYPSDDGITRANPAGIIAILRTTYGAIMAKTDGTWIVKGSFSNTCDVRTCALNSSCIEHWPLRTDGQWWQ
ncbi:hypothetical protein Vretimale_19784 [Volvox reticuliferus]|uniref:Uncharacterized protein n=1 Tax=Volvox reticuliferus TaxID=1737510 RepID=A0A8J4GXE0_9CHLO|nr:hypothetical protein Vretimale_19784 [Volvox reticuliferus]